MAASTVEAVTLVEKAESEEMVAPLAAETTTEEQPAVEEAKSISEAGEVVFLNLN